MKKGILLTLVLLPVLAVGALMIRGRGSQVHEVVLTQKGFEPKEITIVKGDTVKFTTTAGKTFWPASDPHPIHDIYPAFDPKKPVEPTAPWSFRFSKVGEWGYHDHLSPWDHKGEIRVIEKGGVDISDPAKLRQKLSSQIEKIGPAAAYAKLLEDLSSQTFAKQHLSAHFFGEILYSKAGLTGISVCDNSFGFGCYHGFFAKAVTDKGTEIIKKLDEECVARFGLMGLGCPHGIGHGLGEYFGADKLIEQLSYCEGLAWQGPLFGCAGGVFMEHNFPVEIKGDTAEFKTREFKGDYFEPCDKVPQKFRRACIYEQTSWWLEILNNDYQKMGKLCIQLADGKERIDCFRGIGNYTAEHSEYNTGEVLPACTKMPDKINEAFCRAGASWAFFANPEKRDQAGAICEGPGINKNLCLQNSNPVAEGGN